jgi:hypothetical protein
MIRVSQRSCFSFLVLLALALCRLFWIAEPARAQSKQKELPKSVQEKIQKTLDESPGNKVFVFNAAGDETGSTTVSKSKAGTYGSLPDFLKSDNSPAKSCKDPVPTPPPPCIICSSGQVVCSKASFGGKSHSGASHSEVKVPESEKPQ